MKAEIANGTYSVLERVQLLSRFSTAKFTVVSCGELKNPGRGDAAVKPKTHWQHLVIENTETGAKGAIDMVGLTKQALTDKALAQAIFAKLPQGSVVGNEMTITTPGELKATFHLGFDGSRYQS